MKKGHLPTPLLNRRQPRRRKLRQRGSGAVQRGQIEGSGAVDEADDRGRSENWHLVSLGSDVKGFTSIYPRCRRDQNTVWSLLLEFDFLLFFLFFFGGGRFAICSGDFLGMFWVNWWKTSVVWRFGPPKPKDLIIVPKRLALSRGIPPRQPMRDEVTISYWDRPELVVNVEFWSTTSTLENPAWQLNSVCLDMQRADPGNEDLQWWSLLG